MKMSEVPDFAHFALVGRSCRYCRLGKIFTFCNHQGCLAVVRCRSAQLLTIQGLVALGHGVSLVPAMACEMDRGRRCEYRSAGPKPTRMIGHKSRYQSPLFKEFIEMLRREATVLKKDAGHR